MPVTLGDAAASLVGGPIVALFCSVLALFAEVPLRDSDFSNRWRGVFVDVASALPLLAIEIVYPSIHGAVFAVVLVVIFGTAATEKWTGGFARVETS